GAANDCRIKVKRIDAEDIEKSSAEEVIGEVDAILIPGGFGDRGIEGKVEAARYARTGNIPYFGICLGMQVASIEFARNVCGLDGANSHEFDKETPHPIIGLLEDQKTVTQKGGSMRLGSWVCKLKPGTKSAELYGQEQIGERHRHRYEFNPAYRERLEAGGLTIAGTSPDESLVEIVEIADHPHFVAVQFHPEFLSRPNQPHPLFSGFVSAALKKKITDAELAMAVTASS
ncbi:MAG: CTP synthase, partial [Verrucomicrobiales bacterium]